MKRALAVVYVSLLSAVAMASVPNVQKYYNAERNETAYILTAIDIAAPSPSRGELDLSAMLFFFGREISGPPTRAALVVMWIGLERKFSTPAVLAVEIDGREILNTTVSHSEAIDGGTIEESVAADVDVPLLQRIAAADAVTVRVDELRFPLQEVHRERLRELLDLVD